MAPAKGNQFWKLRSKHGRDKLFETSDLLWEAACEYFDWCDNNPWVEKETTKRTVKKIPLSDTKEKPTQRPYTISGLCLYLSCNVHYFTDFKKNLKSEDNDFSYVITRIEQVIYTNKFEGAAVGAFNANIIARDLGLSDKKDLSSSDGTMTPKSIISAEEVRKISNDLENEC